jgi:hypothetical protein
VRLGRAVWRLVTAVAGAAVAACGGSQRATPSGDAAGGGAEQVLGPLDPDPCDASRAVEIDPEMSIANFEPTSSQLAGQYAIYASYDLTGTMWGCQLTTLGTCAVSDETPVVPDPLQCRTGYAVFQQESLPASRCGADGYGLHLSAPPDGGGLTGWGMNLSIDFRQNCNGTSDPDAGVGFTPCFVDASRWTGISFWARLGPQSTGATALVTVGDPHTSSQIGDTPPYNLQYPFNERLCGDPPCVPGGDGGSSGGGLLDGGNPQCDPFGKAVLLVSDWQFYAIPFSEMRQKGYGVPESTLELSRILGFKFSLGKGAWDVWLDDIAFYKAKSR